MKESTDLNVSGDELKSCCAQLYENDVVRLLNRLISSCSPVATAEPQCACSASS